LLILGIDLNARAFDEKRFMGLSAQI